MMKTPFFSILALGAIISWLPLGCSSKDSENSNDYGHNSVLDKNKTCNFVLNVDASLVEEAIRENYPAESEDAIATRINSANDECIDIITKRLALISPGNCFVTRGRNGYIYAQLCGVSEAECAYAEKFISFQGNLSLRLVSTQSDKLANKLFEKKEAPCGFKIAKIGTHGPCYVRDISVPEPDLRSIRSFGNPPPGYIFMLQKDRVDGQEVYHPFFVERSPQMSNPKIADSKVSFDKGTGEAKIRMRFFGKDDYKYMEIRRKYCKTDTYAGRRLAVVLDNIVYAAPVLEPTNDFSGPQANSFQFNGFFTDDIAQMLSDSLKTDTLPMFPVEIVSKEWL